MKVAVLTDVHGNLPALQVTLESNSARGCRRDFSHRRRHRHRAPISRRMRGTAAEHVWHESDLR